MSEADPETTNGVSYIDIDISTPTRSFAITCECGYIEPVHCTPPVTPEPASYSIRTGPVTYSPANPSHSTDPLWAKDHSTELAKQSSRSQAEQAVLQQAICKSRKHTHTQGMWRFALTAAVPLHTPEATSASMHACTNAHESTAMR